jgi:hypothetical protein
LDRGKALIDRVLTVSKSGWRSLNAVRDADLVLFGLAIASLWLIALASVGVNPGQPLASGPLNLLVFLSAWFLPFGLVTLAALEKHRPQSPLTYLRDHLLDRAHRGRIAAALPLLMMITLFMTCFSGMKSAVPLFQPYTWDQTFIELDRTIHGTDPWRLLQPLLGYPIVTSAMSVLYHLWLLLIYMGGVWFAIYCPDAVLRRRYFLAYLLLWSIGGVAMAIGFASVGPCFAQPLLGIETFAAQMDYLRAADQSYPVMVLEIQDALLRWHGSGDYSLGLGITAMPSLHVGLACLFWLSIRQHNRRLGRAFLVFLLIILLGSVHLAYHYAVDGYAAIALVSALWWLSGKLIGTEPKRASLAAAKP